MLYMLILHLSWIAISFNMPVPVFNDTCEHFLVSEKQGELIQTESVSLESIIFFRSFRTDVG